MTKRDREAQARRERLSGTKQGIADAVRSAAQEQHKKDKARVLERAEEMVEEGRERRESLGVDRSAAVTGRTYSGYAERLRNNCAPEDEEDRLPNSAPTFGALGRRRRKRPGIGRPPYC